MKLRSQELTASMVFLTALLLATLAGCGPVSSDGASNGAPPNRVSDVVVKHTETGIGQEAQISSVQNLPVRDLLSVLAEASAVEVSRSKATTVSSDTPVTHAENEIDQKVDVVSPAQSPSSQDTMGALDESPELAASMEDDIIVSNVMNEAPPISP
jgi:predicted transcriptional regulator